MEPRAGLPERCPWCGKTTLWILVIEKDGTTTFECMRTDCSYPLST